MMTLSSSTSVFTRRALALGLLLSSLLSCVQSQGLIETVQQPTATGHWNVTTTLWERGWSYFGSITHNTTALFFTDYGNGGTHVATLNGTYLYDIPASTLDGGEYGSQYLDGVGVFATGVVYLPGDGGLLLVADQAWEWMSVYSLQQQKWMGRCAIEWPVGQFYSNTLFAAGDGNDFWVQVVDFDDYSPWLLKYSNLTLAFLAESPDDSCPYINATRLLGGNFDKVAAGGGYVYYITAPYVYQYDNTSSINLLHTFTLPMLNISGDVWSAALASDTAGNFYTVSRTMLAGFRSDGSIFLSLSVNNGSVNPATAFNMMEALPDGSFILGQLVTQQLVHLSRTGVVLSTTSSSYMGGGNHGVAVHQPGTDVIWELSRYSLQAGHKSSELLVPNTTLPYPFGVDSILGGWMGFDNPAQHLFVAYYSTSYSSGRVCRLQVANTSAPYVVFALPSNTVVRGLVVDNTTSLVYVLDQSNACIWRYNASGAFDSTYQVNLTGSDDTVYTDATSLVINPADGLLYTCSPGSASVLRIERNHSITALPTASGQCGGLAFDRHGVQYLLAGSYVQSSAGWVGWLDIINTGQGVDVDDAGTVYVSANIGLVQFDALFVLNVVTPAVLGDPLFIGLRSQRFQVHGMDGAVYSLVSDMSLQLNARFLFIGESRACPVLPSTGVQAKTCWSHPGSYLSEVAVTVRRDESLAVAGSSHTSISSADSFTLTLQSGTADVGFAAVLLDGVILTSMNRSFEDSDVLRVRFISSHELKVYTQLFVLEFESIDGFINLRSMEPNVPLDVLTQRGSHGLLGQTHTLVSSGTEVKDIVGVVDDYAEATNTLTGCQFLYNRFDC